MLPPTDVRPRSEGHSPPVLRPSSCRPRSSIYKTVFSLPVLPKRSGVSAGAGLLPDPGYSGQTTQLLSPGTMAPAQGDAICGHRDQASLPPKMLPDRTGPAEGCAVGPWHYSRDRAGDTHGAVCDVATSGPGTLLGLFAPGVCGGISQPVSGSDRPTASPHVHPD